VPDLLVEYYDLTDTKQNGAIWSDGPKVGTRWIAQGGRFVLIRKATARQKHPGQWIEVDQTGGQ